MDRGVLTNVLVIALVATLAPFVADQLGRWVVVPTAVLEIAFGIVVGPAVLGLVHVDGVVAGLATFGLALLFFLAGYEVDVARLRGPPLNRALLSWVASLLLALFAPWRSGRSWSRTGACRGLVTRPLSATLSTSGQFAVRLGVLLIVTLVWLAVELHLDLVLGAFAAGVVMRQLLTSVSASEAEVVTS